MLSSFLFLKLYTGIKTVGRWILLRLRDPRKDRPDGSSHPFLKRATVHCLLTTLDDTIQVLRKNLNAAKKKVGSI